MIKQETNLIQSASRINATSGLVRLSEIISSSKEYDLLSFKAREGMVHAEFSSKSVNVLKLLLKSLENSKLTGFGHELRENEKKLLVKFNQD